LVTFKSVYMGISYDFFIAQIQMLLMSTAQQKSFLCENEPQEARRSTGDFSAVNQQHIAF